MTNKFISIAAISILAVPQIAAAVENRDVLPLWFDGPSLTFGGIEQLSSIDFSPATPGLEVIGYNERVSGEAAGSGMARTVWRQRFQFRNAANSNLLAQFTITTKSEAYSTADGSFDYSCGDEYADTLNPDDSIPDCDLEISAGIAEASQGGRFLVIATSAIIDYFDFQTTDDVADPYKVHVYDLSDNSLAWGKTWKLDTPAGSGEDWELDVSLSGVGDFLGDDGTDELRVAQVRPTGASNFRHRYTYYNIETGAVLDTQSFSVSQP